MTSLSKHTSHRMKQRRTPLPGPKHGHLHI